MYKFPNIPEFMSRFEDLEQKHAAVTAEKMRDPKTSVNPIEEQPYKPMVKSPMDIQLPNFSTPSKTADATAHTMQSPNPAEAVAKGDKKNFLGGLLGAQGDTASGVMGGLDFGKDVAVNLSNTSGSDEEALMNTANMAFKGAKTGMMLGGPIGAGIGGAAGLIVGGIDMFGDRKKRSQEHFDNTVADLEDKSRTRARNWHLDKSQKEIDALKAIYSRDLNHIDTSHYG